MKIPFVVGHENTSRFAARQCQQDVIAECLRNTSDFQSLLSRHLRQQIAASVYSATTVQPWRLWTVAATPLPPLGSTHIGPMPLAYLPQQKILVNADMYTPPAPGTTPPAQAMQGVAALAQNIQRLKLDVLQHATLHGMSPSPHDAFVKLAATAKVGTN